MSNGMLEGKTAIVTGASRELVPRLPNVSLRKGPGWRSWPGPRDAHPELAGSLLQTMATCQSHGAQVAMIQADLADGASRSTVVDEAVRLLGGPVDILVNNAAASVYGPVANYALDSRRAMFEVNFHAPVDLIQATLPQMLERGAGWVVNVSSSTADYDRGTDGQAPGPGGLSSTLAVYAASKAALNRLSYALAQELRGTGVRRELCPAQKRGADRGDGGAARAQPRPEAPRTARNDGRGHRVAGPLPRRGDRRHLPEPGAARGDGDKGDVPRRQDRPHRVGPRLRVPRADAPYAPTR